VPGGTWAAVHGTAEDNPLDVGWRKWLMDKAFVYLSISAVIPLARVREARLRARPENPGLQRPSYAGV